MITAEKRVNEEKSMKKASVLLLDIEGTTSSISFVKDTLFPYVKENLEKFVTAEWDKDEFKNDLKVLKEQAAKDEEDKLEGLVKIEEGEKEKETLIKNVLWQMDQDRKTSALKQLQGHIWRQGYSEGLLKGHIYGDVAASLKKWVEDGRKLYIYSSGSVEAQKLLFGNTTEGDLLKLLAGHFDTEVGAKVESKSYESIIKKLDVPADEVVFLTDVVKEAVAAQEAGLQVVIVVREGNLPLEDEDKKKFVTINTFDELVFDMSTKKQKLESGEEEITSSLGTEKIEQVEEGKEAVAATGEQEAKPEEKEEAMDVDTALPQSSEITSSKTEQTTAVENDKSETEEKSVIEKTDEKTVEETNGDKVEKVEEDSKKNETEKTEVAELKKTEVPELKKTEVAELKKTEVAELKKTEIAELKKTEVAELNGANHGDVVADEDSGSKESEVDVGTDTATSNSKVDETVNSNGSTEEATNGKVANGDKKEEQTEPVKVKTVAAEETIEPTPVTVDG